MTANVPTRRIDDLELPTTGTWHAARASSVVMSAGRGGPHAVPVLAGWFEIGEDPIDTSLRLDLDHSTLFAACAQFSPDRQGKSEWHLEGFAESADQHDPLTLTLSYHGVFRLGGEAWAWLSGTGTIGTPSGRRGLRRSAAGDGRLVVELLFTAPDVACIPPVAPMERTRRAESRVMQLPSIGSPPVVLGLGGRAARQAFA